MTVVTIVTMCYHVLNQQYYMAMIIMKVLVVMIVGSGASFESTVPADGGQSRQGRPSQAR